MTSPQAMTDLEKLAEKLEKIAQSDYREPDPTTGEAFELNGRIILGAAGCLRMAAHLSGTEPCIAGGWREEHTKALISIALSSCCEGCQEAQRVAIKALNWHEEQEEEPRCDCWESHKVADVTEHSCGCPCHTSGEEQKEDEADGEQK